MDGVSVVLAVLAAVVIILALLFYVVTLVWAGRNRAGATTVAAGTTGGPGSAAADPTDRDRDSSGSLARGFSYLHVSPQASTRRPGVQQRLARAYRRIDAVDPHVSSRRIGEALLKAGFADAPPPPDRKVFHD